jgi:hypothetical protein
MNLTTSYKNDNNGSLDNVIGELSSNMSGFDSITLAKAPLLSSQPISRTPQLSAQSIVKPTVAKKPYVFSTASSAQVTKPVTIVTPITQTSKVLSGNLQYIQRPTPGMISRPKIDIPTTNCPSNASYSNTQKSCVCNDGYAANTNRDGCVKIANSGCPDNSVYNPSTGYCDCADGYVADSTGRYCVKAQDSGDTDSGDDSGGGSSSQTCPENSVYNSSTGYCDCVEGYSANSDGTGCIKSSNEYTDKDSKADVEDNTTKDKPAVKSDNNKYYYIAGGILAAAIFVYLVVKKKK